MERVSSCKKKTFHGLWFFAGSQANFLASNFRHLNKKCLTHLSGHHITTPAFCGLPHEKGSVDAKPSLPSTLQSPEASEARVRDEILQQWTLVVKTHTGRGRRQKFLKNKKKHQAINMKRSTWRSISPPNLICLCVWPSWTRLFHGLPKLPKHEHWDLSASGQIIHVCKAHVLVTLVSQLVAPKYIKDTGNILTCAWVVPQ